MDFSELTVPVLERLAERRNITVASDAKKDEIVAALEAAGPFEEDFYRDKVLANVKEQMALRNIPEEERERVLAALIRASTGDHEGGERPWALLEYPHLKRAQRELPAVLTACCGGRKRRPRAGQRLPAGFDPGGVPA